MDDWSQNFHFIRSSACATSSPLVSNVIGNAAYTNQLIFNKKSSISLSSTVASHGKQMKAQVQSRKIDSAGPNWSTSQDRDTSCRSLSWREAIKTVRATKGETQILLKQPDNLRTARMSSLTLRKKQTGSFPRRMHRISASSECLLVAQHFQYKRRSLYALFPWSSCFSCPLWKMKTSLLFCRHCHSSLRTR